VDCESNAAESGAENTAFAGGTMAAGHRSNGAFAGKDVPPSGCSMQNSSRNALAVWQAVWMVGAAGSASFTGLHQL
jgi:hypothetical protein